MHPASSGLTLCLFSEGCFVSTVRRRFKAADIDKTTINEKLQKRKNSKQVLFNKECVVKNIYNLYGRSKEILGKDYRSFLRECEPGFAVNIVEPN